MHRLPQYDFRPLIVAASLGPVKTVYRSTLATRVGTEAAILELVKVAPLNRLSEADADGLAVESRLAL